MLIRLTASTVLACSGLALLGACSNDSHEKAAGASSANGSNGSNTAGNTPGSTDDPAGSSSGDPKDNADPGQPAVQFIGRFDATSTKTAWPGGRIIGRFSGTTANATLSQVNGLGGGNSWLNVVVDGQVTKKIELSGASQQISLATDLAPGPHVVELEKRTEPKVGTIVFEGFDFPGGELLAPPPRLSRRIEFLSDSTIDGFGVDGNRTTTCADGAPVSLDNVRKSVAFVASSILKAESHVIAQSGKGIVQNEAGSGGDTFPALYGRTLPDVAESTWDFSSWTPDAVVISLGGTDLSSDTPPEGFAAGYDALVATVRGRYPNAHIYMTVWSQIKDLGAGQNLRTALRTVLDGVKAAHAFDTKLHVFAWNEADYDRDETGCAFHANEEHGIETANEIVPVITKDLGW